MFPCAHLTDGEHMGSMFPVTYVLSRLKGKSVSVFKGLILFNFLKVLLYLYASLLQFHFLFILYILLFCLGPFLFSFLLYLDQIECFIRP
jgi:hypothetical protein